MVLFHPVCRGVVVFCRQGLGIRACWVGFRSFRFVGRSRKGVGLFFCCGSNDYGAAGELLLGETLCIIDSRFLSSSAGKFPCSVHRKAPLDGAVLSEATLRCLFPRTDSVNSLLLSV